MAWITFFALAGMLNQGCVVERDPVLFLADLEVAWDINGSTSPEACDIFGIDRWIVDVQGPDWMTIDFDCRRDYWSTGPALYNLLEGYYLVSVTAKDSFSTTLMSLETDINLISDGFVEHLALTFYPSDF